jgi:hypothetical protein
MKVNFKETIKRKTDKELEIISNDYVFYSEEERFVALNELKYRNVLSKELSETKKEIESSIEKDFSTREPIASTTSESNISYRKIVAIILGVAVVIYIWIGERENDRQVYGNPEFTNAVVVRLTHGRYSYRKRVYYEFTVNGKQYKAWGRREANVDKVGDRIVIIYNKRNPTYNKLCRDSKYSANCNSIMRRRN